MKWLVCLLTIASAAPVNPPFWRVKERAYERVRNGEILTSVQVKEVANSSPKYTLTAAGGGWVNAPRDFVFKTAEQIDRLAASSNYVTAATYDRKKSEVTIDLAAFGYKARFVVEVHVLNKDEPWRIEYKIKDGPLTGMVGKVTFTPVSQRCEVGFEAEYKYDTFQAPVVFVKFGFEVVLQRMAARLRAFTEEEWRMNRKVDSR